ncbi:hypothetical protein [Streptosporangium amethystogenes]|uniref:hypothetical protein n=1 Tax=Streptosporangium amethystogenes TaxID=2002 RepID=UPI0004CAA3A5|nr:hypothetical protein [Streptosporangium amethystogenes]
MKRNTVVRAMHDVGLAAWFGGSLMGAVGLNGAASVVSDRNERLRVANAGWARWAPISAAGIGTYLIGSVGLLVANRKRLAHQKGVVASTVAKGALTAAAVAAAAYTGVLGAKLADAGDVSVEGAVKPGKETPDDVADAQRQLRVLQWVLPAVTGSLIVLTSLHGEQQRPGEVIRGAVQKVFSR